MGADFKVHAALTTPFGHDRLAGQGLAGVEALDEVTRAPPRVPRGGSAPPELRVMVGSESLTLESLQGGGAGVISALANARADVLVRLRDEASHDAQRAVDSAREELPDNLHVKRAVSERPADRGIRYAPAPRAPLGS